MDVKTNYDMFMFLKTNKIAIDDYNSAAEKWIENYNVGVSGANKSIVHEKMRRWSNAVSKKWKAANRTVDRFLNINHEWLNLEFNLHIDSTQEYDLPTPEVCPPQHCKPFVKLSDRQKRRNTEDLRNCSEEMFDFVLKKKYGSDDDKIFILEFIKNHPEHTKRIREYCEKLLNFNIRSPGYNEKMLGLYSAAKLSKFQYNAIRNHDKEYGCGTFPSYYSIRKTKNQCYPDDIKVTESGVAVALQSLLDHTSLRLLNLLTNKIENNQNQN